MPGRVLEHEETYADFVYLLIRGSVRLMKRPENLYNQDSKVVEEVKHLLFSNPKD